MATNPRTKPTNLGRGSTYRLTSSTVHRSSLFSLILFLSPNYDNSCYSPTKARTIRYVYPDLFANTRVWIRPYAVMFVDKNIVFN